MNAEKWFEPVLKNDRFSDAFVLGEAVVATDGRRLHSTTEDLWGDYPAAEPEVAAKIAAFTDDSLYREISDPDLWGPYEEIGLSFRAHLFEDVVLDERFFSEAAAGLGRYTCAVCKDNPCASPVRFRSLDGRREAYIMPYRVSSQC